MEAVDRWQPAYRPRAQGTPLDPEPDIDAALILVVEDGEYVLTVDQLQPLRCVVAHTRQGGRRYQVTCTGREVSCGCDGWKYRARTKRGMCKHVAALIAVGLLPKGGLFGV